jgi:hypothetical protein
VELELPDLPSLGQSLHRTWMELSMTRQASMGIAPVTWSEIVAWQVAMGISLTPWEAETLQAMDQSFRIAQSAGKS